MGDTPPDYYAVLEIPPTATPQHIRDAYKKAALRWHPDRVAADSPERTARTKKFQLINDAYYTLSDPTRRRDYDAARTYHQFTGHEAEEDDEEEYDIPRPPPQTGAGSGRGTGPSFPWSAFGFGGNNNNNNNNSSSGRGGARPSESPAEEARFANEQFGSVFEEMLREEGLAEGAEARPTGRFWSILGGLSGGTMGFIVANIPGALAGALAGNRLGAVRDSRGKSVYEVFQELDQSAKARLLTELLTRIAGAAISG